MGDCDCAYPCTFVHDKYKHAVECRVIQFVNAAFVTSCGLERPIGHVAQPLSSRLQMGRCAAEVEDRCIKDEALHRSIVNE